MLFAQTQTISLSHGKNCRFFGETKLMETQKCYKNLNLIKIGVSVRWKSFKLNFNEISYWISSNET